jgi:hypothetical protein
LSAGWPVDWAPSLLLAKEWRHGSGLALRWPHIQQPVDEAGPDPPNPYWGNILMWEKLTPDDIARVKHQLSLTRAATLSRHAAELKSLDAERGGIEELERLIAAFAQKYSALATCSLPVARSEEQSTEVRKVEAELLLISDAATAGKPAASDVDRDIPSSDLHVQQHVSPNFGTPLRRFVGR